MVAEAFVVVRTHACPIRHVDTAHAGRASSPGRHDGPAKSAGGRQHTARSGHFGARSPGRASIAFCDEPFGRC